jgi:hypothetical protein
MGKKSRRNKGGSKELPGQQQIQKKKAEDAQLAKMLGATEPAKTDDDPEWDKHPMPEVVPGHPDNMTVNVNQLDGSKIAIEVPKNATVGQIKRLIKAKTGCDMSKQKLYKN